MKGERLMPKVYDRRDRYVGYVDGNSIYDRKRRLIGFVQDNMVYDSNYNPVSFFYNDSFYWMNGMPWGYFDGRAVRDVEGRKLGRVRNEWSAIVSAPLLLGRNFQTGQHEYVAPVTSGRHNRGYVSSSNYSQNPVPQQQYVPQTNMPGFTGNRGYGLGGIMQNIMGAGRNLLNGLGGVGRFNPAASIPMGNPGAAGMPVQNINPGAVPAGGVAGNPGGLGFGMQDIMNLGRVMLGNVGGAAAGGAAGGAAAGAGGAGALATAAGWLRPIGSVVGQYFLKNPNAAMNLLSKFVLK